MALAPFFPLKISYNPITGTWIKYPRPEISRKVSNISRITMEQ